MPLADEMDRVAFFLDHVAANAMLVCPHDGCGATFNPSQRLDLMASGRWLQPHQEWLPDGTIKGEPRVAATMGFVIHAFMAPFVKLPETARLGSGQAHARCNRRRHALSRSREEAGRNANGRKPGRADRGMEDRAVPPVGALSDQDGSSRCDVPHSIRRRPGRPLRSPRDRLGSRQAVLAHRRLRDQAMACFRQALGFR